MAYKTPSGFIEERAALSLSHRQPPKLRRPRLLALPLVLLCALAYVGSALHFAFEQHSVCLEHGESVHVDEVRGAARSAEGEGSFADSRIARTSQVASLSHGAEAHCAHAFFRREAPPPPAGTVVSATVEAVAHAARFADALLPEPLERLRLAPKSSPPRV